jgi:ADP-ribose pyrophosphatase YjhB (NUDIX family)
VKAVRGWRGLSRGVFLVNCLAIVYKEQKILIGKRVLDPYIKNLGWGFPGGRPVYHKPLEDSLRNEVRKKTGIEIQVLGLYHARLFPRKPGFLLLYYVATPIGGELRAGEKFAEVKWVNSRSAEDYFTTPIDEVIRNLLRTLDEDPRKVLSVFEEGASIAHA